MSEFPWFSAYPEGVPHEIDPDLYPSIPAILDEAARKFPDRIGYTNMGVGLSYRRTVELSKQFAAYLQSRPDLKPGDRVAVMMPNLLQYVVAVFGILRAGLIVVNVNPLYTAREVNHTLRDSGAKAIVIIENFCQNTGTSHRRNSLQGRHHNGRGRPVPLPEAANCEFRCPLGEKKWVPPYSIPQAVDFREALEIGSSTAFKPVPIQNTDIAFLQYTGGTTGIAKGAELTHRNLVAKHYANQRLDFRCI